MKDLIAPGNWFMWNGKPHKVSVSDGVNVRLWDDDSQGSTGWIGKEHVAPIPLTPDLLRRLGFEQTPKANFHSFDFVITWPQNDPDSYGLVGFGDSWEIMKYQPVSDKVIYARIHRNMRYLHELQSWFGAMGQDLPVTAEMLKGDSI